LPVNQMCAGGVPTLIPSCNATMCALKQSAGPVRSGNWQEAVMLPHTLICGRTDGELSFVAAARVRLPGQIYYEPNG
jgi:hypothetical protein